MNSNYDDTKEYLLGGLDPGGRESIELRVIEDEEFGTEAMAAEDQLIESYLDGELSEDDVRRFTSSYLVTEERVRRVKELAALRAAVSRSSSPRVEAVQKTGFDLSNFFGRFGPALAMGAAALVLVAVAGWWLFSSDRPATDLESQYASLNKGDMSDLNRLAAYSEVELVPGTLRSTDGGSKIVTSNLTETVLFRLPLDFEPPSDTQFRALILRDEKGIFTVDNLRPVRDSSGLEFRVLLPKALFQSGQYQIRLSQYESKNAPIVFNLTAE